MNRILVLGGTGHVGAAVVHEALARGLAVGVATRREVLPRSLAELDIEHLHLDIADRTALRAAVVGCDLVVDAAVPYPLHVRTDVVSQAIERMRLVTDTVGEAGARFAFISSFVTLPSQQALRTQAIRAEHPYFAVKQAMEDEVMRAAAAGLPAAIVNPSALLGPWDDKPTELSIIPQLLTRQISAMVRSEINVVDVRDVARGVLEAVVRERFGELIPLSGHNLRADELAERVCALANVPAPSVRVPLGPTLLGAMWLEAAHAGIGVESPYPALGMMLIAESEPLIVGDVQRELGVLPRDLDETLRDSIAWARLSLPR